MGEIRDLFDILSKALMLKEVTVRKQDGSTYQSKRWVKTDVDESKKPYRAAWSVLSAKPIALPSMETAPFKEDLLNEDIPDEVRGDYSISFGPDGYRFSGSAKDRINWIAGRANRKLTNVAVTIAEQLKDQFQINTPKAMQNVEVDWDSKHAGSYHRHEERITLSPNSMMSLFSIVEQKKVDDYNFHGLKTFVHEAMHHASNIHNYEGWVTHSEGDETKYRYDAALEEATTEILAHHYTPDVAKNLLGIDNYQAATTSIFIKVEDPFGDFEYITDSGRTAYSNYVERFANLIAYVDELTGKKKMTNAEFQTHVSARALEVKQKSQLKPGMIQNFVGKPLDARWDVITEKVMDKFHVEGQIDQWIEQSNYLTENPELAKAKRESWRSDIQYGIQQAIKHFLTKSEPFDRHGAHVGVLEEFIKEIVSTRGTAYLNDNTWVPSKKQKFIGKMDFDNEGRVLGKKKPKEPEPEPELSDEEKEYAALLVERDRWAKEDAEAAARKLTQENA